MIATTEFTLDNGLRVVHNHDPHTAMVAVNVMYNVGARDENENLTGLAHLFEHLMFGGSINIPDFDGAIEHAGGMNNAWTSNDFTSFYDILPAANAETAFWLESDRMLSLDFNTKALEVQRNVVIEEFKQVCLNQPYGLLGHEMRKLLYTVHPYRWPTIGREISHIEKVTLDDIRHFFMSHYAPNNAVLAVVGNISADETRRLAEKWFGPIPRRDITPRLYAPEPAITQAREATVHGIAPQTAVYIGFPMPAYSSRDYIVCDLITDILSSGKSSRMYKQLVNPGDLFSEADASVSGSDEAGFIMLSGKLLSESPAAIDRARDLLMRQVTDIASNGVTDYELTRAINRFESDFTFSTMSFLSKAQKLAECAIHGEDINTIVARYRAVTVDDIARVARRYLVPDHSATLVYRPEE